MKSRLLAALAALLLCVLPLPASADWLESQEGPVPLCVSFSFTGLLAAGVAGQVSFKMPVKVTFPANLGSILGFDSGCVFATAATGSSAFLLQDNGSTVATLTVSGSGTTCGLSTQVAFSVPKDDLLSIVPPSTSDATLATGSVTVCGTR